MKVLRKTAIVAALTIALTGVGSVAPSSQAEAYSGSSNKGCNAYKYARGGYSSCIATIQRMLNGVNVGYGSRYGGYGLTVDNSFGTSTYTQVRRFQKFAGLTSDGIVGRKTWNQLCFYAGQVNFNYKSSGATQNAAWRAAFKAGCYVEIETSTGIGYKTISRY